MQQTFTNALGTTTSYTVQKVKEAINTLNNKRKERLMLLFDYIEDQGQYPVNEFVKGCLDCNTTNTINTLYPR